MKGGQSDPPPQKKLPSESPVLLGLMYLTGIIYIYIIIYINTFLND